VVRPPVLTTFPELGLIEPLLRAVKEEGYTVPTPIQAAGIAPVLAGRDLIGIAQTGTGKTAAFALPILQLLTARNERPHTLHVLVLAPTRELAAQIGASFTTYGRHTRMTNVVIYGGVGQDPQVRALRHGVDVLIATPGRLLDLLDQGHVSLARIRILVLDEADRMLDMGFIHDVRKIIARLPRERQTLFFSATMPDEVTALARSILRDPVRVEVTPAATTAENVAQSVYFVDRADKRSLLAHLLHTDRAMSRVLVFSRTKHGANRIARDLERERVMADAIHGNKAQGARERALANFAGGSVRVLVATDIAARGIDVEGITHVVNFDLPNIPESYVHRIGRTARAGSSGIALSFCDAEEREFLTDIERLTGIDVPAVDHPYVPSWASSRRAPSRKPAPSPARRLSAPPPPRRAPVATPARAPAPAKAPAPRSSDESVASFIAQHRRRRPPR
jgi:ATP-dependent RNA helicase RhlE